MPESTVSHNDITRVEHLTFLNSVGANFPLDTKLPTEIISKRVDDAFNYAQERTEALKTLVSSQSPGHSQANLKDATSDTASAASFKSLEKLPMWNEEVHGLILDGTMRQSYQDLLGFGFLRKEKEGELAWPSQSLFKELRQDVLNIAWALDQGLNEVCLLDSKAEWAVYAKIASVRVLKHLGANVPVFLLEYRILDKSLAQQESTLAGWRSACDDDEDKANRDNGPGRQGGIIMTSDLERRFFLRLLEQNAAVLSDSNNRLREHGSDQTLESFLLPLGPLDQASLGKLMQMSASDKKCEVCGSPGAFKCTGCLSASYCSKDCQRYHWKTHKPMCQAINGGQWSYITLAAPPVMSVINRLQTFPTTAEQIKARVQKSDPSKPLKMKHGSKVFMVKLQVTADMSRATPRPATSNIKNAHAMMYDRERSFTAVWNKETEPEAFDTFYKHLTIPKLYMWARRADDWALELCLDKLPPQNQPW